MVRRNASASLASNASARILVRVTGSRSHRGTASGQLLTPHFRLRKDFKAHDKSNNANPTLRSEEAGRSRQLL